MKRLLLSLFIILINVSANAQFKQFIHLNSENIKIDSILPHFISTIPIGENYTDSIYKIEIKYPEFVDLTKEDIKKYYKITSKKLPTIPTIKQQLVIERKKGTLEYSFIPIVERNGKKQFLVSCMIALKSTPKIKYSLFKFYKNKYYNTNNKSIYANHSILSKGKWAKIRVPDNGIYELTPAIIKKAGFQNINKVKIYGYGGHLQDEVLKTEALKSTDDLKEVESTIINGKRLFYGKGPIKWISKTSTKYIRNYYSQYGYYFLTENDTPPLLINKDEFIKEVYPLPDDYHELHEIDNFSWYEGGRNLYEKTPIEVGESQTFSIPNKGKSLKGTMEIVVTSGKYNSEVNIQINGEDKGLIDINLENKKFDHAGIAKKIFYLNNLKENNIITLRVLNGGTCRLDYISMTYEKPKDKPDFNNDNFPSPEYVYNITNQDLHSHTPVDMVIIIPSSQKLKKQAERLSAFHKQHDGMKVRIVPADELYNEFSSGTPDAMAYRRYLKMLYDRAKNETEIPKSLLLFGDCVWDNRMLTDECKYLNPDDYLLSYESDNSYSSVDCYVNDGWFTLMDEGEGNEPTSKDKEDIGVGRIPAVNDYEAKIVVDKTINYSLNKTAGSWENIIMYMGDDGDNNLHMEYADHTAEAIKKIYPNYQVKKVMWDAYKRTASATGYAYPEATNIIKAQQQMGALIMNYSGHGSASQLSHEKVITIGDFKTFTNKNLPLWITASCDIMPFDGTIPTIGEAALLNEKGGCMAFWGTTRTVYAYYNRAINTAFLKHVLSFSDGKPITLGEAQRRAKVEMITNPNTKDTDKTINKLHFALLGDPALSLNLPQLKTVVTSINDIPINKNSLISLKGGSIVKIKGYIEKDNKIDKNFKGKINAKVWDTEETIICKMQESDATYPFKYTDRQKILYNGTDSVRNGEFNITFVIPLDLNYSNLNGLINLYAVNDNLTKIANGIENRFYINSSNKITNDNIGPSVYCYLNSPSFNNGGKTNSTPFFVAKIKDKDGINASGNGIGHDIELIIDNKINQIYKLTDNFKYDFGSYTQGETHYLIPELEEGKHKLEFKVWDILNNLSVTTLNFVVDKNFIPNIENIRCTKNPMFDKTSFIINNNLPHTDIEAIIEIFDTSGRLIWTHKENFIGAEKEIKIDWNTNNNNGIQLHKGIYLYRVKLGNKGKYRTSKANKLIVLNNN